MRTSTCSPALLLGSVGVRLKLRRAITCGSLVMLSMNAVRLRQVLAMATRTGNLTQNRRAILGSNPTLLNLRLSFSFACATLLSRFGILALSGSRCNSMLKEPLTLPTRRAQSLRPVVRSVPSVNRLPSAALLLCPRLSLPLRLSTQKPQLSFSIRITSRTFVVVPTVGG